MRLPQLQSNSCLTSSGMPPDAAAVDSSMSRMVAPQIEQIAGSLSINPPGRILAPGFGIIATAVYLTQKRVDGCQVFFDPFAYLSCG